MAPSAEAIQGVLALGQKGGQRDQDQEDAKQPHGDARTTAIARWLLDRIEPVEG